MTRTRQAACAAFVAFGLLVETPGLAAAEPPPGGPDNVASLITEVADANQKLQDFGAAVRSRQESVNKAKALFRALEAAHKAGPRQRRARR